MCKKCKVGLFAILAIILTVLMSLNKGASVDEPVIEMSQDVDSILRSDSSSFDTISIIRATRYNPSVEQCDASPFNTADGTYINPSALRNEEIRWCALSWDLMDDAYRRKVRNESWAWRGDFKFGDTIYVESASKPFVNGKWVVHDVMNSRYRKSIDFLVHKDNMNPRLGVCRDLVIIKM